MSTARVPHRPPPRAEAAAEGMSEPDDDLGLDDTGLDLSESTGLDADNVLADEESTPRIERKTGPDMTSRPRSTA
jgi:hypothetical protein